MMDHVIVEGKCMYKDSTREHTLMIYHDQLKIWWEKESQDYLNLYLVPLQDIQVKHGMTGK
jgi:hypothetical protein